MKVTPECVPCLLKRVLFQAQLANNGTESKSVQAALKKYAEIYDEGKNSAESATEIHRCSYDAMGVKDPYLALKLRADEVAEDYISYAEEYVKNSSDSLRAAFLMSVVGNIMDFGSGIAIDDPDQFKNVFSNLVEQGIYHDDTDIIKSVLKPGSSVIYVFDNCGESQLDKILIKELQTMGARVVGVVRGEPILNDVTYEDAIRIGMEKVVDRLLTSEVFAIGVDMSKIGKDLREEFANADLIIAKGMANFESFSDWENNAPLVHVLRTKCNPVSKAIGVPIEKNVVKFVPVRVS